MCIKERGDLLWRNAKTVPEAIRNLVLEDALLYELINPFWIEKVMPLLREEDRSPKKGVLWHESDECRTTRNQNAIEFFCGPISILFIQKMVERT
jgi:hypothetical protein